jgi:hypothetical protein
LHARWARVHIHVTSRLHCIARDYHVSSPSPLSVRRHLVCRHLLCHQMTRQKDRQTGTFTHFLSGGSHLCRRVGHTCAARGVTLVPPGGSHVCRQGGHTRVAGWLTPGGVTGTTRHITQHCQQPTHCCHYLGGIEGGSGGPVPCLGPACARVSRCGRVTLTADPCQVASQFPSGVGPTAAPAQVVYTASGATQTVKSISIIITHRRTRHQWCPTDCNIHCHP